MPRRSADARFSIASHLTTFEGRSSFSSWASRWRGALAVASAGLEEPARGGARHVLDSAEPSASPEQRTADLERAKALRRAIESLSEDHREVILLRDVET
jgi:DNA-directed RNA polymerase specialized sigma24 family protein